MYDPDKDPIAKEILFEKYLYKDEIQFAIPKLNQTINNPLIEKPELVPRIKPDEIGLLAGHQFETIQYTPGMPTNIDGGVKGYKRGKEDDSEELIVTKKNEMIEE
jgi:hypothetical protein